MAYLPITLVVQHATLGSVCRVNRDLLVVRAKAVTMGVWIGEKAALKHTVLGYVDACNQSRLDLTGTWFLIKNTQDLTGNDVRW